MSPFIRLLQHRWWAAIVLGAITSLLCVEASKVKPDYSVEHFFPRFDQSRADYERFKKEFPFEDARALVVIEAQDLYSAAGLARVAALEDDLARVPGVLDTQSLRSVKDLVSDGVSLRMEGLFADGSPSAIARGRATLESDPLFRYTLASPKRPAGTIAVTLTKQVAAKEETRTLFFNAAEAVIARHRAEAATAGVTQRLTLSGLPVIRSQFTAMVSRDLGVLFPIALCVVLVLLYVAFRRVGDVFAALVTILVSILWTVGMMGMMGISLQMLTQITPIVVMIISISDSVHVIAHTRERLLSGAPRLEAVTSAVRESLVPCLLTELTIAGGFLALWANDMVMIQDFGIATAAGMLATWLANFTVLPLLLSILPQRAPKKPELAQRTDSSSALSAFLERVVTERPRAVLLTTLAVCGLCVWAGSVVGREYYSYDDLRPEAPLRHDLRYVEEVTGGSVPMAIFIEPKVRTPDAMLEPAALALIDRITHKLEGDFGEDVKNAASLSKYMRKAHRLLLGDEVARSEPLPGTRRLAAQELLAVDDPRALRDVVSVDRSTAAVFVMMPDRGSSRSTKVLGELRRYLEGEQQRTGYRLTVTGIYGIADGIYRGMVGGLAASLGLAVLVSFVVFFLVLRSWRLALIALVPNLLPLLVTVGVMGLTGIDIKPSTVIVFSITLVIADDDTIQFLSRFRRRYLELSQTGDAHRRAVLDTLRTSGSPMLITALSVAIGFLALGWSEFLGLANLGLLMGVSLISAVLADLFLTPILLMKLKPKL